MNVYIGPRRNGRFAIVAFRPTAKLSFAAGESNDLCDVRQFDDGQPGQADSTSQGWMFGDATDEFLQHLGRGNALERGSKAPKYRERAGAREVLNGVLSKTSVVTSGDQIPGAGIPEAPLAAPAGLR